MRCKITKVLLLVMASFAPLSSLAAPCKAPNNTLQTESQTETSIAQQLGWVPTTENRCGGYYLEAPFPYSKALTNKDLVQINSNQLLFAQHGTSISQGKVTITRQGQQIIASKAYLYRDPTTEKLSSIDLSENVILREPNSLVVAKSGHFDLKTKNETLRDLLYRTTIYANNEEYKNQIFNLEELQKERKITQLSAWGQATEFKQVQKHVFDFTAASYSTCPPTSNTWQVRASHIELNKDTGRGVARNARVYVKGVPIFYTPYLNFPIDNRRQTGFLSPTVGTSSKTGGYITTPFYWNIAPNYDATITPAFLSKRNLQTTGLFRYLTPYSYGEFNASVLPSDRAFGDFQQASVAEYSSSTDPAILAELRRLNNASDTRKSVSWQDNTRFNDHWSSDINYNRVSDDYYLTDLQNNIDEVTQNQLLQQADINYQSENWKFIGRAQGYQTLHPIDQTVVQNQYTRLPQLIFQGDYPNRKFGLDYFITNDLTHFDITDTPGSTMISPTGNRLHFQPGIAYPLNYPDFYFNPRLQFALTKYELSNQVPGYSTGPSRALPIFDIHSGLYFDRDTHFLNTDYRQTLEPQIYYTYVPYRYQNEIPVFDTTLNTLTYDELFTFNRFSGLDRIGDANQISYGIATRFIDERSGYEKFQAGIGQIIYFKDREVTLCYDNTCIDNPTNPQNSFNKSPLSAILQYHLTPNWSLTGNSIWDVQYNEFDNQTLALQYSPDRRKIINLGYSYVRGGDQQNNEPLNSPESNLSLTDLSMTWPIYHDWSSVARWTQNWNHHHFQNLLFGLQYDSCCWAVRFVTGRAFTNLSPNNTYQYNTEFFIQFALKGLGVYGNADPSQLLNNSITSYQSNFGQDY